MLCPLEVSEQRDGCKQLPYQLKVTTRKPGANKVVVPSASLWLTIILSQTGKLHKSHDGQAFAGNLLSTVTTAEQSERI